MLTGLFFCSWGGSLRCLLWANSCCTKFAARFCLAPLAYVSSSSAISMGCVPRDFLASCNSSVVSEAELGISVLELIVMCVTKMDSWNQELNWITWLTPWFVLRKAVVYPYKSVFETAKLIRRTVCNIVLNIISTNYSLQILVFNPQIQFSPSWQNFKPPPPQFLVQQNIRKIILQKISTIEPRTPNLLSHFWFNEISARYLRQKGRK